MAEITSSNNPTLLDVAKRQAPDGSIADVAEVLDEVNDVIPDVGWVESNMTTGHMVTIRTGLPTPTWRKINHGVIPTKSTTAQVTYGTGIQEAYSEIDEEILRLNNFDTAWRASEDRPHLEGMAQEFATTLFFGDESTSPEEFTGLAQYYNDATAQTADNIIEGGGTGTDNASIWFVVWGPNTIHGIYPKGTRAGLQTEDLGIETKENTGGVTGALSRVHRMHYLWRCGLVVRDWRYAVRIANIDKSALDQDIGTGANLAQLMFQAIMTVPNTNMGRGAFYMSRFIMTRLFQQLTSATTPDRVRMDEIGGRMISTFHGFPIRRVDVLDANESQITGL